MDQVLEHDPGHVRTREHYEAMVRELEWELEWARDLAAMREAAHALVAEIAK